MKLELDETCLSGLAARRARLRRSHGSGRESRWRDDARVWAAAKAEARLLVTCDLDFSDLRAFAPGSHQGLLIVRLPDAEQWRTADHLVAWFSDPDARSWAGCLVVATVHKERVVRSTRRKP